jgi:hypothetical protein
MQHLLEPLQCCFHSKTQTLIRPLLEMVLHPGTISTFAIAANVEVVEGAHEGEQIFVRLDDGIVLYSVRSKVWRK